MAHWTKSNGYLQHIVSKRGGTMNEPFLETKIFLFKMKMEINMYINTDENQNAVVNQNRQIEVANENNVEHCLYIGCI